MGDNLQAEAGQDQQQWQWGVMQPQNCNAGRCVGACIGTQK